MENVQEFELLDFELLRGEDISDYDYNRCEFVVYKWFKNYRRLQRNVSCGPVLLPSTKYKLIWVDEGRRGINGYNDLDEYIDNKSEYYKCAEVLKFISESLSHEENILMTSYYLLCKTERKVANDIGCARNTIPVFKKSFVIKFACKLNQEVEKGNKLPDDLEEEYQLWLSTKD